MEFENLSLQDILANHYQWLVFSLLKIQYDPFDHMYPLLPKIARLLEDIDITTFIKYGDWDIPYRDTPEGKHLFTEEDKRLNRVFQSKPRPKVKKDLFEDKAQDLIAAYDDLMHFEKKKKRKEKKKKRKRKEKKRKGKLQPKPIR